MFSVVIFSFKIADIKDIQEDKHGKSYKIYKIRASSSLEGLMRSRVTQPPPNTPPNPFTQTKPHCPSRESKMAAFRSSWVLFSCLFYLLCFLPLRVLSCGMSTHIDIAHQAINWFKDARNGTDYREIILQHQDAFITGNPYPDSMYSNICYSGKFHSISEATHWAPFLNATVNYIRKKYPKPWDQVSC